MVIFDIGLVILLNFIFTPINSQGVIDGPPAGLHNFIITLVYLFFWFAYSFKKGRSGNKSFLIFSTIFWILGALSLLWCMRVTATPLWAVSIFYIAPLNGLNFVFQYSLPFINLLLFVFPLALSYLGYFLGFRKQSKCHII